MSPPRALSLLLVMSCTGQVMSPPPAWRGPQEGGAPEVPGPMMTPPVVGACEAPAVASSPMRRLTRAELERTLKDLLGGSGDRTGTFPPEEQVLGFDNQAAAQSVSPLYLQQLMQAAEGAASEVDVAAVTGCAPSATAAEQSACAAHLLTGVGARAFRRPLTDDEQADFTALFHDVQASQGFEASARVVLQALLQSPQFLYRLEPGRAGEQPGQVVALDGYELATRLSYLLWGTLPDDQLVAAAQHGELASAEQVEAQARRMLADERAHAPVDDFFGQWLQLDQVDLTFKSDRLFARVRPSLRAESAAVAADLYWHGRAPDFFTATHTFANAAVASVYGLPAPAGGGVQRVELDPATRPGLLTRLAFLSVQAKPTESSPLKRGKFIRERVLCQPMPDPPPGIPPLPELAPGQTTREHFAAHTQNPACAVCHERMDPIGFGLERYDELGRYRTMQAGQPIDDSGNLSGAGDISGGFHGPLELMNKLAGSSLVTECLVRQSFRFALGRAEADGDTCSRQSAQQRFVASGGDFKELTIGLAVSDAFRFRLSPAD